MISALLLNLTALSRQVLKTLFDHRVILSPVGGVMSLYGMGRYSSGGLRPPELFF
jgi:hypothetical protein